MLERFCFVLFRFVFCLQSKGGAVKRQSLRKEGMEPSLSIAQVFGSCWPSAEGIDTSAFTNDEAKGQRRYVIWLTSWY